MVFETPKKPISKESFNSVPLYKCPVCGYWIGTKTLAIKEDLTKCPDCGTTFAWEEE